MITFDNLVNQVGDKLGIGYAEAVQRIREAKQAGDPELDKVANLDVGLTAASRLLPSMAEFGESFVKGGAYDLTRSAAYPLTWIDPEVEKWRESLAHKQAMLPSRLGEAAGELASFAVPFTAGTRLLRLLGATSKLEALSQAMVGLPKAVKKAIEAGTVTAEQLDKYGSQIARAGKWAKSLETGATMGTYGALSGNTLSSGLQDRPAGAMDILGETALWTAGGGVAGKLGDLARRLPILRPTEEIMQTPAGRGAIQFLARKTHKAPQQVIEEFRTIGQLVPKLTEAGLPQEQVSALLDSMTQKNIDDLAVLASGPTDEEIYRSMMNHPERGFFSVEPPQTQPVATLTTQLMNELGGRVAPTGKMFGMPELPGVAGGATKVNPFFDLPDEPIYDELGRQVYGGPRLEKWIPDAFAREMELPPTTTPVEDIRKVIPEMPWLREAAPVERTRPFVSPVTLAEILPKSVTSPAVLALPESLRIKQLDVAPQSIELGLTPAAGNYVGQRYVMSSHPESIGNRQAVTLHTPLVVNVPVDARDPEEVALKALMGRKTGGDGRILDYFEVSSGWIPSQVRSRLLQEFVAKRAKDAGYKSLVYRSAAGEYLDQAVDISGKITTSSKEMKDLVKFYKTYGESKVLRNAKPPEQSLVEDYGVEPTEIVKIMGSDIPMTAAPQGAGTFGKQVQEEISKIVSLKPVSVSTGVSDNSTLSLAMQYASRLRQEIDTGSVETVKQIANKLHQILEPMRGQPQSHVTTPSLRGEAKNFIKQYTKMTSDNRPQHLAKEIANQLLKAMAGQTTYNSPQALLEELLALLAKPASYKKALAERRIKK